MYDADSTVRGELALICARLGRSHCAPCDITHGLIEERAGWRNCRADLPIPLDTYDRDDRTDAYRAVLAGAYPAVVVETTAGDVIRPDLRQLAARAGSTTSTAPHRPRQLDATPHSVPRCCAALPRGTASFPITPAFADAATSP